MKSKFFFFILSIFLVSCNKETEKSKLFFFNETDLGSNGSKIRIFINSKFSECGEWGGHEEKLELYAKEDKNFYLDYKKYKVNCDDVSKLYGKPEFQKLDIEQTILVDSFKKQAILQYISELTKAKITEFHIGHSGQLFSVSKSDSTFIISVYSESKKNIQNYNNLQKALGLQVTKNKTE